MNVLQTLIEARKLIANRMNWCTGGMRQCAPDGVSVAYCAAGALYHVLGIRVDSTAPAPLAEGALQALAETALLLPDHRVAIRKKYPNAEYRALWEVVTFNDQNNHDTVLAWFDRTIGILRAVETLAELLPVEPPTVSVVQEDSGGAEASTGSRSADAPPFVLLPILSLADIEDEARREVRERELEPA